MLSAPSFLLLAAEQMVRLCELARTSSTVRQIEDGTWAVHKDRVLPPAEAARETPERAREETMDSATRLRRRRRSDLQQRPKSVESIRHLRGPFRGSSLSAVLPLSRSLYRIHVMRVYTILYYTILYYTILYYTILYYTTL